MQPLCADPRTQYTPAQITALLTAPDVQTDFGVELLTPSLALVEDISGDVSGWVVHHDNLATQHGTLNLTVSRALAWGAARVRPYKLLSSPTVGELLVRFNQGVYLLTGTPDTSLAESIITYTASGFDQLHLLQAVIGESYFVAAGANVLNAVRDALTAAGIVAPVLLDSSANAAVLASDLVYPLTRGEAFTWVRVINDLLAAVVYQPIWCDWDGVFRSGPLVAPADRPAEFTFAVGDLRVGVVAPERTASQELWNAPNWWRFVLNGLTAAPIEGDGMYTVENKLVGLSSQISVDRVVKAPVVFLDAVNQSALKAQGDAIMAAAMRSTEVITAKTGQFAILWHSDVVGWSDPALGADRKALVRSWSLPSGNDDGDLIMETVT